MSSQDHDDIEHNPAAELHRALRVEGLEDRNLLAADFDDSLVEAQSLGTASVSGSSVAAEISMDTDVDMYKVAIGSGQTVRVDVDTPTNGGTGLGGYMRIFNEFGQQLAANNDAAAPGEGNVGFDPYLQFTPSIGGVYFIGISSYQNTSYDPISGDGDQSSSMYGTGSYNLSVNAEPEVFAQPAPAPAINSGAALAASGEASLGYTIDPGIGIGPGAVVPGTQTGIDSTVGVPTDISGGGTVFIPGPTIDSGIGIGPGSVVPGTQMTTAASSNMSTSASGEGSVYIPGPTIDQGIGIGPGSVVPGTQTGTGVAVGVPTDTTGGGTVFIPGPTIDSGIGIGPVRTRPA